MLKQSQWAGCPQTRGCIHVLVYEIYLIIE
jgi:hypothetical protein